jgi:hemin uptake protein HemP
MEILSPRDKMNAGSNEETPSNAPPASPKASAEGRKISLVSGRLDSRDLFVNTREITIAHGNEVYRLRLTAQNKLILTK